MIQKLKLANPQIWLRMVFIFSLLGLIVAGYLWYQYQQPSAIGCNFGGGCEQVRNSDFSALFGVDLPIWGMLFYLGLCMIVFAREVNLLPRSDKLFNFLIPLYTIWGVIFSAYLTYLEVFVIQAICQWCVVSALLTLICFVCAAVYWVLNKYPR